ncbi:S-adenosylmethionine decarboxylase [Mucilaginibacter sp. HMF5004]|uniref:S-adenosylmethionine decarboxylase family protein n=1 Tax=Mucilaginibacter rivuli TaxID=2857527 RepID=UPI001C5CDF7E|nr:S-adenosylmethionine decarboxylase [Mucilaginibacter rivuli]MBW4888303.1 S-adenosylmethionine decarboxylase [Mucilaginibacter rivuli]
MPYQPGLHILVEFSVSNILSLSTSVNCKVFFDRLIVDHSLEKVGEVYHDFDGAGFTAVVCLTESHLSIHTWPEFNLATFDIFLSNYQKDNSDKVRAIYSDVLEFFEATEMKKTELVR